MISKITLLILPHRWAESGLEETRKRRRHASCRVNQPTGLHHINCSALGPFINLVPARTLVCCSICDRNETVWGPLKGDKTNVCVTHGGLTQEVKAMLCSRSEPPHLEHRISRYDSLVVMEETNRCEVYSARAGCHSGPPNSAPGTCTGRVVSEQG